MYLLVFGQTIVSFPAICPDGCAFLHDVTNEWLEISKRGFWNMTHSDSPKTFRFFDLNSYCDNRLTGSTSALPTLHDTTEKGFIDFDNTQQSLSFAAYHPNTVTLKNGPCRPITDAQGSFQGFGRKAVLGGCKVPSSFKPSRQWCPRFFHNRASRHGCLMTTRGTDQAPTRLTPRLPTSLACRATKAIWPPQLLQVDSTCIVIGKMLHKLAVDIWKISSCCHAR